MTPTPPSTTSSHGANSPDFKVVRKRNRIPLSCAPCRHRKLKCNRQSPCDNCVKRNDATSCTYAAPTSRKKGSQAQAASTSPDDMQNRIDRLEGLVLSLMTNGPQSAGPSAAQQTLSSHSGSIGSGSLGPNLDAILNEQMMDTQSERADDESETEGVTQSMGILKVDAEKQKTIYIGEAHWSALLNEIGEVKNYFTQHKREFELHMEKVAQTRRAQGGSDIGSGPALLFGASIPPSRGEILSQLPSRYTCDILVGRYFNTYDPSTNVLHGPAFQRQYTAHWNDPSKTSIVWIGMLFAMLRLAMISYGREGDEPPELKGKCQDLASLYRTQMAHCMITADYTKPHNFLIETLIFHMHAEYTSNRDTEASVWVLAGMIARLAMRMGYHRDSKMFPNVTPFQGEMRRRIWTFVRSADLLFSFQLALPSMIRIGDSDTELPRNIYDDEFDEDSTELPPSRPPSEATPISYMIAKGRLAFGFGRVLEEVNGVNKHGYDEILKIDKGLQEIYQSIPDHLKLRPMAEQQLAPMTLIVARFSLATVYHKSQCVLHRRFVRLARGNNKYMYSRRMCVDSAMQLLSFQTIQHQQSQNRGRLRSLRNHVNSLTTHDFLLGASVLCMDMYSHRERLENDISTPSTSVSGSHSAGSISGASSDGTYITGLPYTRDDLLKALEQSREIWYANRDYSMEAYKASELLSVLLQHIRSPYSPNQSNDQGSAKASNSNGGLNNSNDEQTAAMTLGMLQSGGMSGMSSGMSLANAPNAAAAAELAQQAQQQGLWDGNGNNGSKNPMMNAFLNNSSGNQGFGSQGVSSPNSGGVFGPPALTNAIFPDGFFSGINGGTDMNMNFDWDTWDNYMQPSNLSLDPAANLWSTASTSNNNNIFSSNNGNGSTHQTPSAESNISSNPNNISRARTNETPNGFGGMNSSNFFTNSNNMGLPGQSIGADLPKNDILSLTRAASTPADSNSVGSGGNANNNNNDTGMGVGVGTGGDAFMGASTPGAGQVGIGGWRWTVGMGGDKPS